MQTMESLPLEKQQMLDTQTNTTYSALNPHWKADIRFLPYKCPPSMECDQGPVQEWQERVSFIIDDLQWLLKQKHHVFWSHVVYDETLWRSIDTFLRYAPRSHDVFDQPISCAEVKSRKLYKLYFMVCLRMATCKESKDCFITPHVFGEIIYESYVFDIPKLMDLCALYRDTNAELLSKMIDNIFKQQPKYKQDLKDVVPTIMEVFEIISTKMGVRQSPFADSHTRTASPQKLAAAKESSSAMTCYTVQDVLSYYSDTVTTLHHFLNVYPPACDAFSDENFLLGIANFYEQVVPVFSSQIKVLCKGDPILTNRLQLLLRHTQLNTISVFRHILYTTRIQPLLNDCDAETAERLVEEYLQILTSLLSEKRFLSNLDHKYSCAVDMDIIHQSSYAVDETRLQFINDGITEAYGYKMKKHRQKSKRPPMQPVYPNRFEDSDSDEFPPITDQQAVADGGATAGPVMSGVELDSMISSIKDLLPELGEGFIEKGLEVYNYKVEDLINGLLEDKLPENLNALDKNLKREEKKPHVPNDGGFVEDRANIYDNDEFDVFRRENVDQTRIHRGKKEKLIGEQGRRDVMSVLDDKEHLKDAKEIYHRHGNFEVVNMLAEEHLDVYDDEYDDTYDGLIGAGDADSADELASRRPFVQPRVFGKSSHSPSDNDSDGADEDKRDQRSSREAGADRAPGRQHYGRNNQKKPDFCDDPAKIRERNAQRRATQQYNKHASGNARKKLEVQERTRDVVGAAKGQGQSKEVLRNRAYKEKNKNKGRREQADRKRKV